MVATSQLEVQDQPAALFAEQKEGREDAVDQATSVLALGPARGPSNRPTVGWWGLRLIELDMPVYVHIDHPRPLESSASLSKPPSLSLADPDGAPPARAPHLRSLHVASALTMTATCSCRVTVRSCSTLGALSRCIHVTPVATWTQVGPDLTLCLPPQASCSPFQENRPTRPSWLTQHDEVSQTLEKHQWPEEQM